MAPGELHLARLCTIVDQPEQHQELRPGTVALIHRVRIEPRVLPQALEEPRDRVEPQERLVLRQHVPLLRVEQEHEA